jgi:hypothetical protein
VESEGFDIERGKAAYCENLHDERRNQEKKKRGELQYLLKLTKGYSKILTSKIKFSMLLINLALHHKNM